MRTIELLQKAIKAATTGDTDIISDIESEIDSYLMPQEDIDTLKEALSDLVELSEQYNDSL